VRTTVTNAAVREALSQVLDPGARREWHTFIERLRMFFSGFGAERSTSAVQRFRPLLGSFADATKAGLRSNQELTNSLKSPRPL
jgi:hypothetical protein